MEPKDAAAAAAVSAAAAAAAVADMVVILRADMGNIVVKRVSVVRTTMHTVELQIVIVSGYVIHWGS